MLSHNDFDLISLMTNDIEHPHFHVLVGHWFIFFGEMSIQILCPFLNHVTCLFIIPVVRILYTPYFAMYNVHSYFLAQNFQGKKNFCFNLLIQLSIYVYLDTCFLNYKGILAFIFEHIMVQEFFK